jgi:hypothetical protein
MFQRIATPKSPLKTDLAAMSLVAVALALLVAGTAIAVRDTASFLAAATAKRGATAPARVERAKNVDAGAPFVRVSIAASGSTPLRSPAVRKAALAVP